MVYVAVELDKRVFDKFSGKLLEQGKKEDEKLEAYKFQEGEMDAGGSVVNDIDLEEDGLSVSADFSMEHERLGNVYVSISFDDIGWDTLIKIKTAIDEKLAKIAEAIKALVELD